ESNAGNGRLELMRNSVQKGVLALVTADLTHQKDGVKHNACDENREQNDTQDIKRNAATVDVHPRDIKCNGEPREADTKGDEECYGSTAAGQVHACSGVYGPYRRLLLNAKSKAARRGRPWRELRCSGARWARVFGVELGDLHSLGETKFLHQPDAIVVHVELIPCEPMTRAHRMCMVVVMPSFATRQKSDPPAVARVITCLEPPRSKHMCCGIDEPCCVQTDRRAEERTPQQHSDGARDAVTRRQSGAQSHLQERSDG